MVRKLSETTQWPVVYNTVLQVVSMTFQSMLVFLGVAASES